MTDALKVTSSNIMAVNMVDGTMSVMAEYWSSEAAPLEIQSDLGKVYPNSDYATIIQFMLDGQVIVLQEDDDKVTLVEKNQFTLYDVKSMMFVPIMAHGQLLGDIELWESRCREDRSAYLKGIV